MANINNERFLEMIRSANIFLSIFDLNILYDENDDIPLCSFMPVLDGKGNIVGMLRGPLLDRETRKRYYSVEASTTAFPKIKAQIVSSKKKISNEHSYNDRSIHYFYDIKYAVRTKNTIANKLSGSFIISDPIGNVDSKETVVEREIDFNLIASQKPNELFSISSENLKTVIQYEFCDENRYTGNRVIKMKYDSGEIILSIKKDGNSSLRYISDKGECRATAIVSDSFEPYIEVYEKNALENMTEEEKERYHSERLMKIIEGKAFGIPFDNNIVTINSTNIEDDEKGNVIQLFHAISSLAPNLDMYEIPNKACTFMDYLGSNECAPIHVFYSLMSIAFGFLDDEVLTSMVGLNPRKLPDTPTVDNKFGIVILPQHKSSTIVKE